MGRIKIELPDNFSFVTEIPIRITDLNYGRHVGNDVFLSLIHEARVQFLQYHHYKEFDIEGNGLLMGDVAIEFKNEVFYGDKIKAFVAAGEFSKVSFDIFYKLEKESAGKKTLVAIAKSGMIYYDFQLKKMASVPEKVKEKLLI